MSFNKCFVPGCTTGCNNTRKKNGNEPGKTLFKTPLNKPLFERWKKNIPRGGVDLIPGCLVCEIHFPEESIMRNFRTPMPDGTFSILKRSKPILKPGAVPTIFPNLPPHLYRTLKRVDPPIGISRTDNKIKTSQTMAFEITDSKPSEVVKSPDGKAIDTSKSLVNDSEVSSSENGSLSRLHLDSRGASMSENSVSSSTNNNMFKKVSMVVPMKSIQVSTSKLKELINNNSYDLLPEEIKKSLKNKVVKSITIKESCFQEESNQNKKKIEKNKTETSTLPITTSPGMPIVTNHKRNASRKESIMPDTTENFQIIIAQGEVNDSTDNNEVLSFRYLKDNIEDVKVPSWHWSCSFLRNSIAFLDWGLQFDIKKKVIVNYDMKYKVFILDKEISIEGFDEPKSFQDIQNFLLIVDKISVCQGMEKGETKLWSRNCFGFVPPREEGMKRHTRKICDACSLDMKNAPSVQKRDEEKRYRRIQRLSSVLNAEKLKNRGLTLMIQKLRKKIEKFTTERKIGEERVSSSKLLQLSAVLNEEIIEDGSDREGSVVEMDDEDLCLS